MEIGFRPPQFSEDLAWLPAWLQPNQNQEALSDDNNNIRDTQSPFTQQYKVQGSSAVEKNGRSSAKEDAGYKCHLYLSGTDSSAIETIPSANLMHFHLQLSSNGMSQYTPSAVSSPSQTRRGESHVILQSLPENSVVPHDKEHPSKMEVTNGTSNTLIKTKSRSPSASKGGKNRKKLQGKVKCGTLKDSDVTDAIELSIAASEALAIFEIINSGVASEALPASSVLEGAIRVKQARKDFCASTSESISNEATDVVDETYLLQELDEDIMEDAYEDVGLSISPVHSSSKDLTCSSPVLNNARSLHESISRVLDTPPLDDHCRNDVEAQITQPRCRELDFDGNSSERKYEDALAMASFSGGKPYRSVQSICEEKIPNDHQMAADTFMAERIFERNEQVTVNQERSIGRENDSSVHTQESVHSGSQIHNSRICGARNEVFLGLSGQFSSRWLGGWTGKDVNVSQDVDNNTVKRVANFVTRETSFISESANIPDENSVIREREAVPLIASLQSVGYGGLCSTSNGGEPSQELMPSNNLSIADPLCSVVPCSISSDNSNINITPNPKSIEEKEAGKCLNTTMLEIGLNDSELNTTEFNAKHGNVKGQDLTSEYFVPVTTATRRNLRSLRTYSTLMPRKAALEKKDSYKIGSSDIAPSISEFLSFEENIDCFKSSSRKDSTIYSNSISSRSHVQVNETHAEANHANEEEYHDAELEINDLNDRSSPLKSDYQLSKDDQSCPQASKDIVRNDNCGFNSKPALVIEDLEAREEPPRKKVRFLEPDANKLKSRSSQKPRSGYRRKRTSGKPDKRLKKSNTPADSKTQQENIYAKSYRSRSTNRMLFQGLEFLLTGFSVKKEREIQVLIQKHGGFVLSDVPPPPNSGRTRRFRRKVQQLPILLSPKKLQTSKFLYGCAVNAFVLNLNWLTDSVVTGSLLAIEKYMILPNENSLRHKRIGRPVHSADLSYIFEKLGILLHGKHSFCTNFGQIVKHGGGQVFETLQYLVKSLKKGTISIGAIVIEDETSASRHLRHCASEQNLSVMPANWIVESLYCRKLIPLKESRRTSKLQKYSVPVEWSQEI